MCGKIVQLSLSVDIQPIRRLTIRSVNYEMLHFEWKGFEYSDATTAIRMRFRPAD